MSKIDWILERWAEVRVTQAPTNAESPRVTTSQQPVKQRPPLSLQKKPKTLPTKVMVNAAIRSLMQNGRKGVSLAAIKKYIIQNYQTDINIKSRLHLIRQYLRNALQTGDLIRTKGIGITGSFRLPRTRQRGSQTKKKARNTHKKRGTGHKTVVNSSRKLLDTHLKSVKSKLDLKNQSTSA